MSVNGDVSSDEEHSKNLSKKELQELKYKQLKNKKKKASKKRVKATKQEEKEEPKPSVEEIKEVFKNQNFKKNFGFSGNRRGSQC